MINVVRILYSSKFRHGGRLKNHMSTSENFNLSMRVSGSQVNKTTGNAQVNRWYKQTKTSTCAYRSICRLIHTIIIGSNFNNTAHEIAISGWNTAGYHIYFFYSIHRNIS